MGFSFLAPIFLAGLAALAIPVLIHLTHRERKDAVTFPSLMFVRKIPYRTVRRQKIRNWLLFLMRVAAVVLMVAAFARPLIDGDSRVSHGAAARELVILLDRSQSMAYADRWERAVASARRAVDGMGAEDRATLVVFDERAEAVTQPTAEPAVLHSALDTLAVGSEATRYNSALQLAGEIVGRSDRPAGEVLLITDFQSTGWEAQQAVRLPAATSLSYVDLSEANADNLGVVSVSVRPDRGGGRERAVVTAQVANLGSEPQTSIAVALEIDGETVAGQRLDIEAGEMARIQFAPVVLPRRTVRGVVRAGEDGLAADNAFRFVIDPQAPVSVLLLEPRGAGRDQSLYLRRALAIGNEPQFRVDVRRADRLTGEDLDRQSVVILSDAPYPSGAVGRRLRDFVMEGGGLLVLLGRRSRPDAWSDAGLDLLPGRFGSPVDRAAEGGGTLSFLDFEHPGLRLFRQPRSGDFSAARFFRYRRIEVVDPARVIARFDDGAPALAEAERGDGRVIAWTSDLENFWNDLILQPVFLPFAHQLMQYLAHYERPEYWHRVGNVIDLARIASTKGEDPEDRELIVESPSGRSRVVRLSAESRYVGLDQAGFYRIRAADGDDDWTHTVAANVKPAESDLSVLDPNELANAVTPAPDGQPAAMEAAALTVEERERRQGLWWYLLVGAAMLLLIETLISNRTLRATVS